MKSMKTMTSLRKKQGGFTIDNFLLWMVLAALAMAIAVQTYVTARANLNRTAVVTAVGSIKAGAESTKTINHTGVSMAKLCGAKRNAVPMKICGSTRDGVKTNPYGGNYTVTVNTSNSQLIDIGITNVDSQYIDDLADALAPHTAANCTSATSCGGLTVAENTITVTM
ncbi:hypothetical protein GCM10007938_33720 [Vibrio zhanjiangensis]|uniref:Type 4 secretion system PilS N-terminal domain-containing protein n=1 Tax=Vibrio zhanjiangensis TaxID=1046128 RepID=A0ABQ6F430_9VIBR|nr:hypothetical protein [Vibrio zhanjiangensis]GLT19590.1 hypothetical protein GCM10007938_33720 [Vibrio zhanjiangensis]